MYVCSCQSCQCASGALFYYTTLINHQNLINKKWKLVVFFETAGNKNTLRCGSFPRHCRYRDRGSRLHRHMLSTVEHVRAAPRAGLLSTGRRELEARGGGTRPPSRPVKSERGRGRQEGTSGQAEGRVRASVGVRGQGIKPSAQPLHESASLRAYLRPLSRVRRFFGHAQEQRKQRGDKAPDDVILCSLQKNRPKRRVLYGPTGSRLRLS